MKSFFVQNWEDVAKNIYKKCIQDRDELFEKEFLCHIWLNKYLFGNFAIVFLLSKDGYFDNRLLDAILNLKKKIRSRFDASKNGTFIVALDMEKINLSSTRVPKGRLIIQHDRESSIFDQSISQEGRFNSFFFQYVHCPNVNYEDAKQELDILKKMGVLSIENMISIDEWNTMKKHAERLGYI